MCVCVCSRRLWLLVWCALRTLLLWYICCDMYKDADRIKFIRSICVSVRCMCNNKISIYTTTMNGQRIATEIRSFINLIDDTRIFDELFNGKYSIKWRERRIILTFALGSFFPSVVWWFHCCYCWRSVVAVTVFHACEAVRLSFRNYSEHRTQMRKFHINRISIEGIVICLFEYMCVPYYRFAVHCTL